jgi:hypothetical protein
MIVLPHQRGSSLDPSAEVDSYRTTKVGFDLTKPLEARGKKFEKALYTDVDLLKFL